MKKISIASIFSVIILQCGLNAGGVRAEDLNWYQFRPAQDKLAPLVDFSGLNKRISEEDRVVAHNGHFYKIGKDRQVGTADDSRIRLMGVNLSGSANFPDEAEARKLARKLRKLGFNAVRLHQMDARFSEADRKPAGILTSNAFPTLHEEAVIRLKNFISVLKDEGLYVNLNLHVNYQFRPAVDQVNPMLDGAQMPANSHPLHLFDPRMVSLQAEYARQLIRQLDLKNDPVLAMVEINNESSLVGAWQRGDLERLNGEYERTWNSLWQKWILREYGSTEVACQRWRTCEWPGKGGQYLRKSELMVNGAESGWIEKMRKICRRILQKLDLPLPSFLQIRFHAPSEGLALRSADYIRFLIDTEQQYFESIRQVVRQEAGVHVAVTGTQRYYGGVANQLSQRGMDYVDEHFYTDHYDFPGQSWADDDWRIRNSSTLRGTDSSLFRAAFFRDRSKPYVLSEFNQPYPNRQSAEIIPAIVALASSQDWDGLFFFQYGDPDEEDGLLGAFNLNNHSSQLVSLGSLSSVFRQFQIAPNQEQLVLTLSADEILALTMNGESLDPAVWDDFLQRRYALKVADTQTRQVSIQTGAPEQALLRQNAIVRNSAPLYPVWNSIQGNLIWADRFAALFAGFGNASLSSGWSVQQHTGSRQFAVVTMTTRDGLPLEQSQRILLTVAGATTGSQLTGSGLRPKHMIPYKGDLLWQTLEPDETGSGKTSGSRSSSTPVWMEQLDVEVSLPLNGRQIKVYRLDQAGQRKAPLPASAIQQSNGLFTVRVGRDCPWYEITVR